MTDGRDGHGRFVKGNPGGPGRKPRATEAAYLATLAEVCDEEVWRGICARAVQDALNGDRAAREWVAGYLLGKPAAEAPTLRRAMREADEAEAGPAEAGEGFTTEGAEAILRTLQASTAQTRRMRDADLPLSERLRREWEAEIPTD